MKSWQTIACIVALMTTGACSMDPGAPSADPADSPSTEPPSRGDAAASARPAPSRSGEQAADAPQPSPADQSTAADRAESAARPAVPPDRPRGCTDLSLDLDAQERWEAARPPLEDPADPLGPDRDGDGTRDALDCDPDDRRRQLWLAGACRPDDGDDDDDLVPDAWDCDPEDPRDRRSDCGDKVDGGCGRLTAGPRCPRRPVATPGEGQVEIRWEPPRVTPGAEEGGLAGYVLLRSGAGEELLRPIAEVGDDERRFVDDTAIDGIAYRYSVRTVDGLGSTSADCISVPATPGPVVWVAEGIDEEAEQEGTQARPYSSVHLALESLGGAGPGVIRLGPGEFRGPIELSVPGVTVVGAGQDESRIVPAGHSGDDGTPGPVVSLEADHTSLQHVEVDGEDRAGVGVRIRCDRCSIQRSEVRRLVGPWPADDLPGPRGRGRASGIDIVESDGVAVVGVHVHHVAASPWRHGSDAAFGGDGVGISALKTRRLALADNVVRRIRGGVRRGVLGSAFGISIAHARHPRLENNTVGDISGDRDRCDCGSWCHGRDALGIDLRDVEGATLLHDRVSDVQGAPWDQMGHDEAATEPPVAAGVRLSNASGAAVCGLRVRNLRGADACEDIMPTRGRPGGVLFGVAVQGAGSVELSGVEVRHLVGGQGGFGDVVGGAGGPATGIAVDGGSVRIDGARVTAVRGGRGEDWRGIGPGGEAVGLRVQDVPAARLQGLEVSGVRGGDTGRASFSSGRPAAGRATGISVREADGLWLSEVNVTDVESGDGHGMRRVWDESSLCSKEQYFSYRADAEGVVIEEAGEAVISGLTVSGVDAWMAPRTENEGIGRGVRIERSPRTQISQALVSHIKGERAVGVRAWGAGAGVWATWLTLRAIRGATESVGVEVAGHGDPEGMVPWGVVDSSIIADVDGTALGGGARAGRPKLRVSHTDIWAAGSLCSRGVEVGPGVIQEDPLLLGSEQGQELRALEQLSPESLCVDAGAPSADCLDEPTCMGKPSECRADMGHNGGTVHARCHMAPGVLR